MNRLTFGLAAVAAGLARDGGAGQLTDGLIGQVAQVVRPVWPGGRGPAWDQLEARHAEGEAQVGKGLSVVKIGVLLERRGVVVPYRTLHRFCVERCGFGKTAATVRVADGEPGPSAGMPWFAAGLGPRRGGSGGRRGAAWACRGVVLLVHSGFFAECLALIEDPQCILGQR